MTEKGRDSVVGATAKLTLSNLASDSPVISSFQRYAAIMKASQDKYERLFKIRRDITIESKRIIFLLHSIDRKSKKDAICAEAEKRLNKLINDDFKKIGAELEGEDPYLYQRAVSAGNQEFVEALTLLEYLQIGKIKGKSSCSNVPFMPTIDYILGIADLTGELMRRCISNLGTGDYSDVGDTCSFLRQVYMGMLVVATSSRDLSGKMHTLQSSLHKVERIAYNLQILGNEAPKLLAFMANDDETDEGFN